jgi:branched-chain amino acid transport system permease protein
MHFFLSVLILACVYALLASGFVIIYRASRILNFAYANIAMMIGYFTVTCFAMTGGRAIVALFMALAFSALIGTIIYYSMIRPMAGQPIFSTIVLTVALGIILEAITILVWRGELESVSLGWKGYYSLMEGVRLSSNEILIIITTIVFFIVLEVFYRFSKVGQQMRATAENTLLAAQRGINIYHVMAIAWTIGTLATGIAAILVGANYSVSLHMGIIAVKAFSVALVGGLDSIKGIIPAAVIIAASEIAAQSYISPRLGETIPFIIMLLILLVRPWGLWGTAEELDRV